MTVYVDNATIPYGRMKMCHMLADTRLELDAMADRLGVARKHFHRGHYNVCQSKRAAAIGFGAVEVSQRQAARLRRSQNSQATEARMKT